jgi:hypothetical protein
MSNSTKNRLTSVAAAVVAGVAMFGLLSPAAATDQNSPAVLTSHAPWLAPIGHRQQDLDVELDRKLVICRGC